eukprot:TRINITY_DN479_c0_g6_i1.p1 TRINITY_DN479_c0_g6~~TRINITY_DN479_c0_g6_i1.p1  ORF type:complete len:1392 (-),score=512.93 TRINITY_DN479_c0_g6_i1:24-4199(-)
MAEAFVFAPGLSSAVQNFVNNVSFLLQPKLASSSLSEKLIYIALLPVTSQSERIDVKAIHEQAVSFLVAIAADKQNHEALKSFNAREGGKVFACCAELLDSGNDQIIMSTSSAFASLADSESLRETIADTGVLQKFIQMLPTASAYVAEMIVRTIALCAKNEKSQQIFCDSQAVPLLLKIGFKNLPSKAGAHSRLLMYALWALAVLSSNKKAASQIVSTKFEDTDGIGILLIASEASPDYSLSALLQITAIPEARAAITNCKNGVSLLFNQLSAAVTGSCKPETVVRAIKILANLCVDEPNRVIVANYPSSYTIVFNLIAADGKIDAQGKIQLVKLFAYMSSGELDEGDQVALIQAKALERLITLLQNETSELQTQSLSGLSNLICFDILQTRFLELHGSIPLLVSLLSSPNPILKKDAARGLANLAIGHFDDARDAIANAGAILPLKQLLLGASDEDSKKEGLRGLINLARSYRCAEQISQSDVIPTLLQLFQQSTQQLKLLATMLLVNLSANDKARFALTKAIHGQPDQFLALIKQTDETMQLQGLKIVSNLSIQGKIRRYIQDRKEWTTLIQKLEKESPNEAIRKQSEMASLIISVPCESSYAEEEVSLDHIVLPHVQEIDEEEEEEEEEVEEEIETEARGSISIQKTPETTVEEIAKEKKRIEDELEAKRKQEEEQKARLEQARLKAEEMKRKEEELRQKHLQEEEQRRKEEEVKRKEEEERVKAEAERQRKEEEERRLIEEKHQQMKLEAESRQRRIRKIEVLIQKVANAKRDVEEKRKLVNHRQERLQRKSERQLKRQKKEYRKSMRVLSKNTVSTSKPVLQRRSSGSNLQSSSSTTSRKTVKDYESRLKRAIESLAKAEANFKKYQQKLEAVLRKNKENFSIGEGGLEIEKLVGSHIELLKQSQTEWDEAQKKYSEWQQTNARELEAQKAKKEEEEKRLLAEKEKERLKKEQEELSKQQAEKERIEAQRILKEEEDRMKKHQEELLLAEKQRKEAELRQKQELEQAKSKAGSSVIKEVKPTTITTTTTATTPPNKVDAEDVKAKIHQKRTSIAKEIFTVEKNYMDSLNVIIWKFLKPLESSATPAQKINKNETSQSLLPANAIKQIFLNIEIICNFSNLLLDGISKRIQKWEEKTKIGDVFLGVTSFLAACYTEYVNGYDHALEVLRSARKENEALDAFIKRQEKAKECRFLPVEAFLVMPIQQVPRYVMLLADLYKNTPADHPDYNDLGKALENIKAAATKINENKRTSDNLAKVYGVEIVITSKPSSMATLMTPSRRWIKEGPLQLVDPKSGSQKNGYVHLFNDLILFSTLLKQKEKYKYHSSLQITSSVSVESLREPLKKSQFVFKIVGDTKKHEALTFNCQNDNERKEWVVAIQQLTTNR